MAFKYKENNIFVDLSAIGNINIWIAKLYGRRIKICFISVHDNFDNE